MWYLKICIAIYTDASIEGWGFSMGNISTGGAWLPDEKQMHTNVLELKAGLLSRSHLWKQVINTSKLSLKIP